MKYAIIDIGSNTIRINVYCYENNKLKLIIHKKTVAGLASYVEDNLLNKRGIEKAIKVLQRFKKVTDLLKVNKTYVFATASLRNIKNSKEALEKILEKTDFQIDLVEGKDEAKYGFLGASLKYKDIEEGTIFDIGGGSSEITVFKNKKILDSASLCEGSLSIFKNFVDEIFPTLDDYNKIKKYIRSKIEGFEINPIKSSMCIGIGGTIRATGNISSEYFQDSSNEVIEYSNIQKMIELLLNRDPEFIRTVLQVVPERIHTITTGMIIFESLCEYFNIEKVFVSNKGVREGYLLHKAGLEEC